jgi:hypothetical protein
VVSKSDKVKLETLKNPSGCDHSVPIATVIELSQTVVAWLPWPNSIAELLFIVTELAKVVLKLGKNASKSAPTQIFLEFLGNLRALVGSGDTSRYAESGVDWRDIRTPLSTIAHFD